MWQSPSNIVQLQLKWMLRDEVKYTGGRLWRNVCKQTRKVSSGQVNMSDRMTSRGVVLLKNFGA